MSSGRPQTATTSVADRRVADNPLLRWNGDDQEPAPLVMLKTRLVLYTSDPPGPDTARAVYDLYMQRFGAGVTAYRSTALGSEAEDWTPLTRARFEKEELPDLRVHENWGYMFGSDDPADPGLFLFHGARPASEPDRASVFRFDFAWDLDPDVLWDFTVEVLDRVQAVCGTAGYVLVPDDGDHAAGAYDVMFAWAMRYWGAEAQDLDATAECAVHGIPGISWLTIIGADLVARDREAVAVGRSVAFGSAEAGGHIVIKAEARPRLIDRNRSEPLGNYTAVAMALAPLQIDGHVSFAGESWDEDSTSRYLRRFVDPQTV